MPRDLSGLKKFLSRTHNTQQVKDLSVRAHAAMLSGEDQVTITSQGFEGSNASGEVSASSADIGRICEEILVDRGEGPNVQRTIFTRASFAYNGEEV